MSCSALNCKNRAEKGFRLARFPSDPKRRKIWIDRCGRKDWEPSNWSKLCEVHFDPDQWEKHREDGRRKLKPNAVPSLFHEKSKAEESTKNKNAIEFLANDNESNHETAGLNSNVKRKESASQRKEKPADSEIDILKAQNENLRLLIKNYSTVLRACLLQEDEEDRTIDIVKAENEEFQLLLGVHSRMNTLDERLKSVQDIVSAYIFKVNREIQDDIKYLNTDYAHLREIMRLILEFVNTDANSSSPNLVEIIKVMKELYAVISVVVPENSIVKSLLKKFNRTLHGDFSKKTDISFAIDLATKIHETVRPNSETNPSRTESEYTILLTTLSDSPSNVEEVEKTDIVKKVKDDVNIFRRLGSRLKQVSKQLTVFIQAHQSDLPMHST